MEQKVSGSTPDRASINNGGEMKETGLRCNLCGEFVPHDKLVENPPSSFQDIRKEKIMGIRYGVHGEMWIEYDDPTSCSVHICRGCLWMIRKKTK